MTGFSKKMPSWKIPYLVSTIMKYFETFTLLVDENFDIYKRGIWKNKIIEGEENICFNYISGKYILNVNLNIEIFL